MADPGFSRGGGAWTLQGGREHAKFSRKLHEIERIWMPRGGACVPHAPPRSANANTEHVWWRNQLRWPIRNTAPRELTRHRNSKVGHVECGKEGRVYKRVFWYILVSSGGSRIFPRGGREPSRGGVNTPNFPENCMKSKEFGRPGGSMRPSRPP